MLNLRILAKIISIIEQGKRMMMEQNGIKIVTDLMQNSLASSKVLARACFVLGNLAFHGTRTLCLHMNVLQDRTND
jgi:hypothetical protein